MSIHPCIHRFLFLVLLLCGAGKLAAAPAADVLVIVSERSSATLLAASQRLPEGARVQMRSVSQLNEMSDAQLQTLIWSAKSVLMIAVFGEPAQRLMGMDYRPAQRRWVLHSDRRLMGLQRDARGEPFAEGLPEEVVGDKQALASREGLAAKQRDYPRYADWLQARAYWLNRSVENASSLLSFILSEGGQAAELKVVAKLRFALHSDQGLVWHGSDTLAAALAPGRPILWILDHDTGDLAGEWALHSAFCQRVQAQCVSVLAGWGRASVEAVKTVRDVVAKRPGNAAALLVLQDFVIGGGDGRRQVEDLLGEINVPVFKGLRLSEWTQSDYQLSAQGVPRSSIHYRLAMPELQGIGQAQVLAMAQPRATDRATGLRVARSAPLVGEVERQVRRIERWFALQAKANKDKRVAIVYYNHPPGRHNIGADNLNVPESLLDMLRALRAAGYDTGELPADAQALLGLLQERGVNLPEDAEALAAMHARGSRLSGADYRRWFATLPSAVQAEMRDGPLAMLHHRMKEALAAAGQVASPSQKKRQLSLLGDYLDNSVTDIHHALDGLRHRGRERALDLLAQLHSDYAGQIAAVAAAQKPSWARSEGLLAALLEMHIEGIRGWGRPPGKVMAWEGDPLVPGVQFGKVFVGPQPPRGWEINEELLHANLSFPPPHQYLAFYHYIQEVFAADAIVHVGRHSTYEFLPKRAAGLSAEDYPSLIAGDLPGIYPYIVDGVGEGIQAKRRGLAVMVDHLTPPLAITQLYDDLLELRQLIESAEAAVDPATRSRAVQTLRKRIDELELREELVASMDEELAVRGQGFDDIDDDFLLHEVGHYLTHIQERFMPLGLHVFGRDWSDSAVETMLASMGEGGAKGSAADWRDALVRSPSEEMRALLNGLNGRFVQPGKGNDPIRTPQALPTGRNFYALDGSLLPTRLGFDIGSELAAEVLAKGGEPADGQGIGERNKQGVILWASDAVRDEGAMIAFGLRLLGVRPVWNSRGIVKGLERIELGPNQPRRLDVVFTTSGLFRDLYGEHLALLDKAVLMALDASRETLIRDYPALALALREALAPLGEWRRGGRESLSQNLVAANWAREARSMLAAQPQISAAELGRQASLRVFGIAPGAYGAGINRLAERSSAWQDRSELAEVYIKRMGHAYGLGMSGEPAQELLRSQLAAVSQTFLGRASNLYGLIDNNDAFDYLGGLNMAVELASGQQPASAVINHANTEKLQIQNLQSALLGELRGRFLNPQWIAPLMKEGYAGARTMGSEFMEYLWGWQVTSPELISDKVWEEVKAVYVDDKLGLGLDDFLGEGHRRHVQSNILAIMLVAIDKGFWEADSETRQQLAESFAENILAVGLPGSGHSHPNHPVYHMVKAELGREKAQAVDAVLDKSRLAPDEQGKLAASHIREVVGATLSAEREASEVAPAQQAPSGDTAGGADRHYMLWLAALGLLVLMAGLWRGRRGG